jgi:hypothetical protein
MVSQSRGDPPKREDRAIRPARSSGYQRSGAKAHSSDRVAAKAPLVFGLNGAIVPLEMALFAELDRRALSVRRLAREVPK